MPIPFIFAVLPFVNAGLAAAGAGLASVPIIIHLLNRRRFRRIIWAAMEWLLAAQRKNARRIRIEQLILLAIRCLIMILIGLALAQPILQAMNLGVLGQSRMTRVIILDDSYSMNYGGLKTAGQTAVVDLGTPFDKAKAVAKDLINLSSEGRDAIYVVLAGSPARPLFRRGDGDGPQGAGGRLGGEQAGRAGYRSQQVGVDGPVGRAGRGGRPEDRLGGQ
jgi:hypothetical protein